MSTSNDPRNPVGGQPGESAGSLASAVEATRGACRRLETLVADGWRLTHLDLVGRLEGAGDPTDLVRAVTTLAPMVATPATLTGVFSGASLQLRVRADGEIMVSGVGQGDIMENFDIDHRSDAALAWAGDASAALRLPGQWSCRVELKWTAALDTAAPQTQWLFFETVNDVVGYLHHKPFWQLRSEFDVARGTVALVRQLPADAVLKTPTLTVASLDIASIPIPTPPALSDSASLANDPVLDHAIAPALMNPTDQGDAKLITVAEALWSLVVATCWARLATALVPDADTGALDLEYFGLQRVRYSLHRSGPRCTSRTAQESLDLLKWVESAGTVDRLLAVRQVASLRADEPPWQRAGDVRAAAEPIFMALRSGAVAEALKAVRDTRAGAMEVALRAVETASNVANSTVQRVLASIVAIGGIFIADTTKNITASQALDLRLLVAGALFGLAVWNVVIERPALFRPMNDFKADLPTLSELLPAEEQRRVSGLKSLTNARTYALLLAWVVPVLYVALGWASLLVNRH